MYYEKNQVSPTQLLAEYRKAMHEHQQNLHESIGMFFGDFSLAEVQDLLKRFRKSIYLAIDNHPAENVPLINDLYVLDELGILLSDLNDSAAKTERLRSKIKKAKKKLVVVRS